MRLVRRHFLSLAAGAALCRAARAQAYPSRPVRIVSGFPPGGVNDTYARLIGQWLSERLGQQFFVENRPGAGGNIAAESVAKAAADGYSLLLSTSADAWNATLYDNLKFNFMRDFAAVATISRAPGVVVVHPSVPATSVPELIANAKKNPGKITVASAGIGSAPHMYWELFRSRSGVDMPHSTPSEIVGTLNREINLALADPKMTRRIAELGDVPVALSTSEFAKLIADETEKWANVIRTANIRAE